MKTEERHKSTRTSSAKGKRVTELGCAKSGKSANKGPKQRRNLAGNKLVSLQSQQQGQKNISNTVCQNGEEFGEPHLLSSLPRTSSAISAPVSKQSLHFFQKFKLQLFPIDEVTCRGLEMEKHNPYLELTIGTRKKISSVVKHLNIKWGKPKMASGELMLLPYYARLDDLTSNRKWTLNDTGTTATDVHAAIGSPAIFRLRYGWFSNVEPRDSRVPLVPSLSEDSLQMRMNEKNISADHEKPADVVASQKHEPEIKTTADCEPSCSIASQEHVPDPAAVLSNQDVGQCIHLEKADPLDYKRSANSASLIWDLSNMSFGALLSEASKNMNASHMTCDSFDAAIFRFKATMQPTSVPQSSILDAEETCNAFAFQKMTTSRETVPPHSQDAPVAPYTQNPNSNPTRLHDALHSQVGHIEETAYQQSSPSPQLSTICSQLQTRDDSQSYMQHLICEGQKSQAQAVASHSNHGHSGKLDMYWPESLGPWEYAASSSKQFIVGDSIGLDGLIASSLDAFQNVSIF